MKDNSELLKRYFKIKICPNYNKETKEETREVHMCVICYLTFESEVAEIKHLELAHKKEVITI